jgi:hypothetical protein
MSIEAMKQALDALRNAEVVYMEQLNAMYALQQAIEFQEMVAKGTKAWADTPDNWVDDLRGDMPDHFRDATKKVVPSNYSNSHQPVAWIKVWKDGTKNFYDHEPPMFGKHETYPLYISPSTRQKNRQVAKNATTGNQEVAKSATTDWEAVAADQAMTIAMLKLEQKREWVGLTDHELQVLDFNDPERGKLARAVEAKLKEKNG